MLTSLVVAPVVAAAVAILPLLLPVAAALLSSEDPEALPLVPEEPPEVLPLEPDDPLLEPDEPEDPEEPLLEPEDPEDPPPEPEDPLFEFEDPEDPDEPLFEPDALMPRLSAEFSVDRLDEPEKPLLDPLLLAPGILDPGMPLLPEITGGATVFGIARLALNAAVARSNAAIGVDAVPGTLVREPPEEPEPPEELEPPEEPEPPDEPEPPAVAIGVRNAKEIKPARTNAVRGGNRLLMWNASQILSMSHG